MNKLVKPLGTLAALGGAMGVVLLSMAAHTADNETSIRILHSAGLVQSLHMLAALIALARSANLASALFVLGGYMFAGALSLLIFAPEIFITGMAPVSGGLLILGWLALALSELRRK